MARVGREGLGSEEDPDARVPSPNFRYPLVNHVGTSLLFHRTDIATTKRRESMPNISRFWRKTLLQAMVLIIGASILFTYFNSRFASCFSLGD